MIAPAKRIQRRRKKGWQMPKGAVYVGRPTKWGNPHDWFRYQPQWPRDADVKAYRDDLYGGRLNITIDDVGRELAGRDLACWCPLDAPCHADVLLELINRQAD